MRISAILSLAAIFSLGAFGAEPIPLPEHPRPDWERAEWMNLNGKWAFGFGETADCIDRSITVPFGWGTPLSGVETAETRTKGFYRRTIRIPERWKGRRVFLVVGASDWESKVWLDGLYLGCHQGGYVPFEFDLSPFAKCGQEQTIEIAVRDDIGEGAGGVQRDGRLYGKQGYGDVRGIWQTVYLEARGENYLDYAHFLPDLVRTGVTLRVGLALPAKKDATRVTVRFRPEDRKEPATLLFNRGEMAKECFIPLDNPHLWELHDPYLYEVQVALDSEGEIDRVATYFGMRSVGVGHMPGTNIPYITLNGKPHYLRLCLDQSYHPQGYYTFPSDEFMRKEIELTKRLGLDGNRIHIKVEIPRKLYWADKLGCLIMADVPNAWGWPDDIFFREHDHAWKGMLKRDMNHPSIFSWVLFNETWGLKNKDMAKRPDLEAIPWYLPDAQGRVAKRYFEAKKADPTRLIEDNSPCYNDHVISDINSFHGYQPGWAWEGFIRSYTDQLAPGSRRNFIGGFAQTGAPLINSECGNVWGYLGSTGDVDDSWDYHGMMDAFRRQMRCAGWLYTEHHDVTNEWNGYVRFDRSEKDFGYGALFPGMSVRDFHSDAYIGLEREVFSVHKAGERWRIPLSVSLVTDAFAGRELSMRAEVRWTDGHGRGQVRSLGEVARFCAKSWQQGGVGEVVVALPDSAAVGTVNVSLLDGERTIGRNFTCFHVPGGTDSGRLAGKFSGARFSVKEWKVLEGLKWCGAGEGEFRFSFDIGALPASGKVRFQAEVSTRPLLRKDAEGANISAADLVYMVGGGTKAGDRNANAYPQTDDVRHPGAVEVVVGGQVVAKVALPDDPADHRGILSWGYQKRDRRLQDAGTYGYLVEAEIPRDLMRRAANGKRLEVILRSVGKCGLAVYGERFGRYPFGPQLIIEEAGTVQ
ncbi:MAG: glycoside hydrolase family 2 [Kiritimatiellia bacterium]|nr:glycoside hydrolase family 2 [Kiritimatiellia bacterium]